MWKAGDEIIAIPDGGGRAPGVPLGQVLTKAGVFLAVAFVAAGALGAMQPVTGIPAEVIQLTQFGPALGVGVVALLWPARVRPALAEAFRGRGRHGGRGLLLPATAPLIIALCVTAYGVLTGDVRFTHPSALHNPFAMIVVAQLIGACGEEIGWRCFLQPLLRTRFGPLASSIAVGVLWGVWHVPVFAQAPAYAGAFLLATVSMSVVMGLALDRIRSSRLLLSGGFHTLINLGLLLFMDEESGAVLPMALFGTACLAVALLWAWKAPTRIHRIPDHVR
ncbi:CPBP family intramembrane glutamic endopeptidase [Streptosporangium sp. NPDC000396]|uniref:CPBP family intramembrane glutamic endopeptidase n=1 Tax=Streptosporangium sp. NPDC000396 TaxID=3366185 RepID=UPI003686A6BB